MYQLVSGRILQLPSTATETKFCMVNHVRRLPAQELCHRIMCCPGVTEKLLELMLTSKTTTDHFSDKS